MSKNRGAFRSVTSGNKSNSAANSHAHIPHRPPEQLPGSVKSKIAAAKAGHMQVKAPTGMKLPYSLG